MGNLGLNVYFLTPSSVMVSNLGSEFFVLTFMCIIIFGKAFCSILMETINKKYCYDKLFLLKLPEITKKKHVMSNNGSLPNKHQND
ncbi:hypothetical protein BpHYR1_016487 [Brachionus plicatilis]|uniref:Uncharacterized protein n=1 Tax=Brachionus plicatilis TaxID=10195 RepID=A0A3M7T4J4_BRAPC|nr:hypothetical protein BpHYR1_016487 [Brachionus plicatilis]